MRKRIPLVQTTDRNVNQIQSNVNNALAPLLQNEVLQGQLVQGLKLVPGPNFVAHKLGRALIGWVVARQRASASLYDVQDANLQPDLTLALVASDAVEVDLYVF